MCTRPGNDYGVIADTPHKIPTSWSRVADSNPNRSSGFAQSRDIASHCAGHCSTVQPVVRVIPPRRPHLPTSTRGLSFRVPRLLTNRNEGSAVAGLNRTSRHELTTAMQHLCTVTELTNSFRKTMTGMSRPGKVLRVASTKSYFTACAGPVNSFEFSLAAAVLRRYHRASLSSEGVESSET